MAGTSKVHNTSRSTLDVWNGNSFYGDHDVQIFYRRWDNSEDLQSVAWSCNGEKWRMGLALIGDIDLSTLALSGRKGYLSCLWIKRAKWLLTRWWYYSWIQLRGRANVIWLAKWWTMKFLQIANCRAGNQNLRLGDGGGSVWRCGTCHL